MLQQTLPFHLLTQNNKQAGNETNNLAILKSLKRLFMVFKSSKTHFKRDLEVKKRSTDRQTHSNELKLKSL